MRSERRTPGSGDPRIEAAVRAALLRSHAAGVLPVNIASAAIAAVLLLTLAPALGSAALGGWLVALAAAIALHVGLASRHRRSATADAARWLQRYRAGILAHGLVWGSTVWLLPPSAATETLETLTLVLAGLSAGAMTLALFDRSAALLFVAPTLLPLAWRLAVAPTPLPSLVIVAAAMLALQFAFFDVAARRAGNERRELAATRLAESEGADEARRSQTLLRLIFDHIGEGISVFGGDWRLLAINARALELLGAPPDLLRPGMALREVLTALAQSGTYGPGEVQAHVERRLGVLVDSRVTVSERAEIAGRTIEIRRSPIPEGGCVMVYVDVTRRHRAEQQLNRAGELLAQKSHVLEVTLDSLSQGVLSVDAAGRTNAYNRRLLELLDLPEAMMRGRPTLQEISRYQIDQGHFGPGLQRMDEAGRDGLTRYVAGDMRSVARRYQRVKADGTVLDVRSHFAADGSLVRTYTDVTESVRVQQALRESETRFRTMADGAPALIWLADAEGRATWFNQRWLDFSGRTLDEELAASWTERMHPDDYERCRSAWSEAFASRRRYEFEFRLRRADGGWGWIADTGIPRSGDRGGFEGFISYAWEIDERKAAEAALIAAKNEAERANRAKSVFLSRMSHELRTPLNAILGFGQLLDSDARDPLSPGQRTRVQEILRGGHHLLALINEVLDLARIESGAVRLRLEAVDLRALVDEALRLVAPVAQQRSVTLALDWPAGLAGMVQADRLRLQQVLLNLLSNAIKYNREAGSVRIGCRPDGEMLRLEVSDRGPGISRENQARLFQAFERLDADRLGVEGAGIGLALSKWFVDLMAGEIGVTSEPGAGSTFWVRLARASVVPPGSAGTPPAAPAPPALRDRTVLYVEDNPVNLMLMEGMLARRPALTLLSADRPEAGIAIAIAERPDLVLLDIQLPGMDGFEVLRRLRAAPATRGIPVVAVSANAMPEDLDAARRAGFAAYLTKPLDVDALLDVVDRQLANPVVPGA